MSAQMTKSQKVPTSPTVLILDDEEIVTRTLSTYLEMETDYEIRTFESPTAALESLKKKPVDVVISDFYMPEMDGLQFLSQVKKMYPNSTLILLTGYADKENAIKAINEVELFQYIEKPWDNDNLRLIIRNGLANQNLKSVLHKKIRELDNVLLERDKLAQENEMLQDELLLARNVQESMLPDNLPALDGVTMSAKYLPALEIGGDFYDIIPLAQGNLAILLADVTGHGIQAALITALLKSQFATFKDCEASPRKILRHMNKELSIILPRNLFVAAMVATFDLKSRQCHLANAGVPYPYLIRQAEFVERVHANGLLLGVATDELFTPGEEVSLELQPGDRLILFTDGLSEAESQDNERFENEILTETLERITTKAGAEILDELIEAAQRFSKPEHRWDDVTILGIETN